MDGMLDLGIQNARNRPGDCRAQKGLCQVFTGGLEYDNERNERYDNPTVAELRDDEKHPVEEKGMVGVDEGEEESVIINKSIDHNYYQHIIRLFFRGHAAPSRSPKPRSPTYPCVGVRGTGS